MWVPSASCKQSWKLNWCIFLVKTTQCYLDEKIKNNILWENLKKKKKESLGTERTVLQVKCELAASHRALSLHFFSPSWELEQWAAANSAHLTSPSQDAGAEHPSVGNHPWCKFCSLTGTCERWWDSGGRTCHWMGEEDDSQKPNFCPAGRQQSEQWCCQSSAGWYEPPQGSPLSLGRRIRRRCTSQLGFHVVTCGPLPLNKVSQPAWWTNRWLLCSLLFSHLGLPDHSQKSVGSRFHV